MPASNTSRPGYRSGLSHTGHVVRLSKAASVQFSNPILLRVIRVHDWQTYDGWCWLDGYQLSHCGDAVARRSVFVQIAGLQPGLISARGSR
ncbi:hypothetical protein ACFPIJ_47100 [Dactylosporangium cerinum]|uniref:Transposase n=1 Tax=Dactylosporangium cerinum TaxID=1434730 RepID=A0ABV9WDL1_9ACTN